MEAEVKVEIERLHDEEKRQNHRLDELERKQNDIADLTVSVKELAINSKYTAQKVDGIDERLAVIEKKPLKAIEGARGTAINTIVGILVGALLTGLIWLVVNHGGI